MEIDRLRDDDAPLVVADAAKTALNSQDAVEVSDGRDERAAARVEVEAAYLDAARERR